MIGCISNGKPTTTLEAPRFLPQSQPDSTIETGIRQDPVTGGILLQWYSVTGTVFYRIFRSDSTAPDNLPADFTVIG